MDSLAYSPFEINPVEEEGSLAVSKNYSQYLYPSTPDTSRFEACEMVYFEQDDDFTKEESFAMSVPIENVLRYFLRLGAKIESPSMVRDYLYRYPDIAKLARFVSEQVYSSFDFMAQLSLEIEDDEVPGSEYLVIYVRVPEYDHSVMNRIRKIRESYYDLLDITTGWFLLTTDFSHPR